MIAFRYIINDCLHHLSIWVYQQDAILALAPRHHVVWVRHFNAHLESQTISPENLPHWCFGCWERVGETGQSPHEGCHDAPRIGLSLGP